MRTVFCICVRLNEKRNLPIRCCVLASAQLANVSMVEDSIPGIQIGAQIMRAVSLPDGQSPERTGKAAQDEETRRYGRI